MKKILIIIQIVTCISLTKAQILSNTTWSCFTPAGQFFRYYSFGSDTIFFSTATTPITAFATYTESGNSFVINALSGNCLGVIGSYNFSIQNDTLLFNVINDLCATRLNVWGSYTFVNLVTSVHTNSGSLGTKIFPNPSNTGLFTISLENAIKEVTKIMIFSMEGLKVYEESINLNSSKHMVDIENLASGLYVLVMENRDERQIFKIQR